jgi:LacI family transcriptional regulator
MDAPTLRTLARSLGLSRTTISDALRGSTRVNPETAVRVRAAASAAGYERNPLTSAVMSLLRRSRGQQFRGVLAALEMIDPSTPSHAARYNESVLAGVSRRAKELGFKVERFEISPEGVRLSRLHCVCSDHYRSMISLLHDLHDRGYRRPGLFMEITHDERLHFRWEGAFLALQKYLPKIVAVPALRLKSVTRADFETWFNKYEPDVVLGHSPEAMAWMKECGAHIPKTHAFVCLNSLRTNNDCAALDFQAPQLGARAAELVIGQLLHNEFGVPEQPSLTTIPARLIEGPTLRGPGKSKRSTANAVAL